MSKGVFIEYLIKVKFNFLAKQTIDGFFSLGSLQILNRVSIVVKKINH